MNYKFTQYLIELGKSKNTAKGYAGKIELYQKWCEDSFGTTPNKLYRSNILDYISYMRNVRKYSPKSVNNHLSALRAYNEYLLETGMQQEQVIRDADFMKIQIQYASPCTVEKKDGKRKRT